VCRLPANRAVPGASVELCVIIVLLYTANTTRMGLRHTARPNDRRHVNPYSWQKKSRNEKLAVEQSTVCAAARFARVPWTQHAYGRGGLAYNGSALVSVNEVNLRRTRLVLGWVTVSGFNSRRRHFISASNQPLRSSQPSSLSKTAK